MPPAAVKNTIFLYGMMLCQIVHCHWPAHSKLVTENENVVSSSGDASASWKEEMCTCRMRGMMPTVDIVTLERLSPNSVGLIIERVAVRTCS